MKMHVCAAALLAVVLLCSATGQGTDPAEQTRIKTCGSLDDADCMVVKACRYCRSRWGESKCVTTRTASTLPGGVILAWCPTDCQM